MSYWIILSDEGHHLFTCGKFLQKKTDRHNVIRDEFTRLATQAGVRSQKDKLEEFVQLRPNDKRRTDLKLFSQGNSGGDLFVDFTVGHPTADSYMPSASRTPGYTITRLNKTKNDKYLAVCNEVGVDFLPCAAIQKENFKFLTFACIDMLSAPSHRRSRVTTDDLWSEGISARH